MKIRLLFLFLACATLAEAQYSYINDRRFYDPTDLIGYDFKPARMEVPNEVEQEINAGDYSFGITMNNLYVKGGELEGVYNINNISPEDFGFKLLLMNARDARLQGHLKVILNKYGMVEALIFKRSPKEKEIIFYLIPITQKMKEAESAYFTDRGEQFIENPDSLWGKVLRPFLIIHQDAKVQQRLRTEDELGISFEEVVTFEVKEPKKKRSKTEEEESVATDSLAVPLTPETVAALDQVALDSLVELGEVKIIRENTVIIRSNLLYDTGLREVKEVRFPIKKVQEREDEAAGMQEERFMWEFVNDKKELIQLFLNGDGTVSTMQVGAKKYLMRGF